MITEDQMSKIESITTHLFVRPAEEKGWVRTAHVVRKGDKYYVGELSSRGFSEENMEKLVNRGEIIRLDTPVKKNLNQCFWVTPDYEVYLASKNNPLGENEERTYVCNLSSK